MYEVTHRKHNERTILFTRILAWFGTFLACLIVLVPLPDAAAQSFQVVATVDVAVNPFGITTRPGSDEVWVANSGRSARRGQDPALINGKTVTVLNPQSLAITAVIPVGLFPEDIAFTSDGAFAFVTNSTDATVSVIDANTKTVIKTVDLTAIPMDFPFGLVVMPGNTELWVTSVGAQLDGSAQNVAIVDISSPVQAFIKETLSITGGIGRPALTPDGGTVLLPVTQGAGGNPEVLFVNRQTRAVETSLVLPPPTPHHGSPIDFAVTSDGRAFLSLFNDDAKVFVIDLTTRTITGVVATIDKFQHGIGITPDQRFVVVTNHLAASVSVVNPNSLQILTTIPVGRVPNEVAFTSDSRRVFVTNEGDTTVTVIDIME